MAVRESGDGLDKLMQAINFMNSSKVCVGIPQENAQRSSKNGMTNVALAYIHSKGSPRMHIPARPFIEPGVESKRDEIAAEMYNAALAAIEGDMGSANGHLDAAGQEGEDGVKAMFGTGAPNAPITIHGGWMRNPVSGKPFYVVGKGSDNPLINTGALMNSVTHVIRSK